MVVIVLEHHMTISKLWTGSPKTYFLIVRIADKKILYIATLLVHDAKDTEVQLRMIHHEDLFEFLDKTLIVRSCHYFLLLLDVVLGGPPYYEDSNLMV